MLPNDPEMALRYKDCHLIVLRGFQDPRGYGPLWTARQVLKVLAELPPEVRFNFDGIDILCRAHLLTMREFDVMLSQVSTSHISEAFYKEPGFFTTNNIDYKKSESKQFLYISFVSSDTQNFFVWL